MRGVRQCRQRGCGDASEASSHAAVIDLAKLELVATCHHQIGARTNSPAQSSTCHIKSAELAGCAARQHLLTPELCLRPIVC